MTSDKHDHRPGDEGAAPHVLPGPPALDDTSSSVAAEEGEAHNTLAPIPHHLHCPNCEYDWYLSVGLNCPECGLPRSGGLLEQYKEGRRPAPLEYPYRTFLRTIRALRPHPRHLERLVRDFPATAARRWERLLRWMLWPLYIILATVGTAFRFANGTPLFAVEKTLATPGWKDVQSAIPWLAVNACTVIPALILIPRFTSRPLQSRCGLSEGDAFRVYAFTFPAFAVLVMVWTSDFLVYLLLPGQTFDFLLWLAMIAVSYDGWKRSLIAAIAGLADEEALKEKRVRPAANRCINIAVLTWLICRLVSIAAGYYVLGVPLPD